MKKQNTMYRASQKDRNNILLAALPVSKAATQLINKNKCFVFLNKW